MTVTPASSLITIPDDTSPIISFAASSDFTKAGVYTLSVSFSSDGGTNWSTATDANFTYVNPCLTTSFVSATNSLVTSTTSPFLVAPVGTSLSSTSTNKVFLTTVDQSYQSVIGS